MPRTTPLTALPCTLVLLLVTGTIVQAQTPYRPRDCCSRDWGLQHHLHAERASPVPTTGGQEALIAMQQVTALLLSDPNTDWSTVSVARLRAWLVDWNRLMLEAEVSERAVDGGVDVTVTGDAATMESVRRLVPDHVSRVGSGPESFRGWQVRAEDEGDSVVLALRTEDEGEVDVIRALGFFGFMSSGIYRPYELMAVSRGVEE